MNKKFFFIFLIIIPFFILLPKPAHAGSVVSAVGDTINIITNNSTAISEWITGETLDIVGINNGLIDDANCRWASPDNPIQWFNCGHGVPVFNECTPGEWDASSCRACNGKGFWDANCSNYGPNDAAWCACELICTGANTVASGCIGGGGCPYSCDAYYCGNNCNAPEYSYNPNWAWYIGSDCAAHANPCASCGNGTCDAGETCSTCPSDCGACPSTPTCSFSFSPNPVNLGQLTTANFNIDWKGLPPSANNYMDCPEYKADVGASSFVYTPIWFTGPHNCTLFVHTSAGTGTCINSLQVNNSVSCPNGICDNGETCLTCLADCGACPPTCPNGICDVGENCNTCPSDCGVCPPVCPNGICNVGENCNNCPSDCGVCPPSCGDGACNSGENCSTCPSDCGVCPPSSGGSVFWKEVAP